MAYALAASSADIDIPTPSSGLTVNASEPSRRMPGIGVSASVSGLATSSHGSTAVSRSKIWTRLTPALASRTTAKNHNGYFLNRGVWTSVTSTEAVSCFCVLASRCDTSNDPESIASTGPLSTIDSGLASSSSIAVLRTLRYWLNTDVDLGLARRGLLDRDVATLVRHGARRQRQGADQHEDGKSPHDSSSSSTISKSPSSSSLTSCSTPCSSTKT